MSGLDTRTLSRLTWVLVAISCAPTLWCRFLPMMDLPLYVALARVLMHLHDSAYHFDWFYQLDLRRGPAVFTPYLLGALSELTSLDIAARLVVCLAVALYPIGLFAVLRVQGKPVALILLGLPFLYAKSFFLGLLPLSISAGLALCVLALLMTGATRLRAQVALLVLSTLLPLTHPFGVAIVLAYLLLSFSTDAGRQWRVLPWLTPLLAGGAYWFCCALHADGVASYSGPSLVFRLLHPSHELLGGFVGHTEALLLGGQLVLWCLLCRSSLPYNRERIRALMPSERALYLLVVSCLLGFVLLPASTWTTGEIHPPLGVFGMSLLPALVPLQATQALRRRVPVMLCALGIATTWHTNINLAYFDAEARPFASILRHVPARPTLLGMIYNNIGSVALTSPYLHFAAYAQAERGGFMSLALPDFAWTVPLRRRATAQALPPLFGAEWDPALWHVQPHQFRFYNTVIVRGKEPREMTLFMNTPFQLTHRADGWLLYVR